MFLPEEFFSVIRSGGSIRSTGCEAFDPMEIHLLVRGTGVEPRLRSTGSAALCDWPSSRGVLWRE
ncbi:MAG: hypothetical protein GC154_21350 [bacterium]|nr:hypothetical protein [bacterium]